jgi:hypothetical protein
VPLQSPVLALARPAPCGLGRQCRPMRLRRLRRLVGSSLALRVHPVQASTKKAPSAGLARP